MSNETYRQVKTLLFVALLAMGSVFASKYLSTITDYIAEQRTADNLFHCRGQAIQILEGDTLWWIAHENCDGNIINVVDRLVKAYGDGLIVGQTIYLPVHTNCELRVTDGGQVMSDECASE